MRRRLTTVTVAVLAAVICPAAAPAAAYTAIDVTETTSTGYAELLLPDATPARARAALTDYARGIDPARQDLYFLKVQASPDAARYVCRARWYRDVASWQQHAAGPAPSGPWPHLALTCP